MSTLLAVDTSGFPVAEHLIRERKKEVEAATKDEPEKGKKVANAESAGKEGGKGDGDKENGASGPDAANGGF